VLAWFKFRQLLLQAWEVSFSTGRCFVSVTFFSVLPPQTSAANWPRSCETSTTNRRLCFGKTSMTESNRFTSLPYEFR
jgi:hypothetical protein